MNHEFLCVAIRYPDDGDHAERPRTVLWRVAGRTPFVRENKIARGKIFDWETAFLQNQIV